MQLRAGDQVDKECLRQITLGWNLLLLRIEPVSQSASTGLERASIRDNHSCVADPAYFGRCA